MAVYDQMITSYSDTTPHIRVISDVIQMIDPVDTPLLDYLGGLDTARSKFRINQNGYKVEILEDEYAPLASTAASTALTASTTLTNFTVADASIFQDGHVIQIDDEYMVVKAADTTNNTITVYSRSYGGTNATHASTSAITIVGMARLEGDDADYGPIVDITAPYNYTSIFQEALKVSGTQQVVDQYGISDEFAYQANKIIPSKLRLLNRMAFHGVRAAGSASAPRSAGGLGTFITNNSVNAGGAIVKADIDGLMEAIYADGGNPDVIVMNQGPANDIRDILDSSSFVRVSQEESVLGMNPIRRVRTQYGELNLLMDRHCPVAKAYVLDSSKVGFYQLRPFAMKPLSVTGDSVKGEVVGEFSFLVANDKAHGYIYGITS
jgi:hypothetical protein